MGHITLPIASFNILKQQNFHVLEKISIKKIDAYKAVVQKDGAFTRQELKLESATASISDILLFPPNTVNYRYILDSK